jgi:hypothetical protein
MNNKYLTIFWHQNKEYVSLETFIEKEYIKDIKITNELFEINNEKYTMTFNFFNEINQENIEFNSMDNKLKIKLEKKQNNYEYWNYLSKNNEFKNQIKVNWNFWKDEDEEEDNQQEMENMPFNMEEMMASMQNNT